MTITKIRRYRTMKKDIKKTVRNFKNYILIMSAVLFVSGLLLIVFPQTSVNIICYIVGIALCILGIMSIVGYFREMTDIFGSLGLAQGIALIAAGLIVVIRPLVISGMITLVFGIIMVLDGILKLQYAFDLFRIRAKYWWVVLVASAVMITVGAIVVFNPFGSESVLVVFTGVFLILDSLSDVATVMYISHAVKDVRRELGVLEYEDKEEE